MLKSISIKNYRSFGGDGVCVDDFDKINIFIGKNNSGKTNILKFLNVVGGSFPWNSNSHLSSPLIEKDYYKLTTGRPIEFRIVFTEPDETRLEQFAPLKFDEFYLELRFVQDGEKTRKDKIGTFVNSSLREDEVRSFVQKKGTTGGSFDDRLKDVENAIKPYELLTFQNVVYLGEFRKLVDEKELRTKLKEIVNYNYKLKNSNENKKIALLKFVSEILEETVEISIPSEDEEIELIMSNGRHFPLSSYGTGLQQVILFGFYLITNENKIICIDEPELHLHPKIQRSLLRFISEETNNQYFISTHSNTFLDFEIENKKVYWAYLDENDNTKIDNCDKINNSHKMLNDLGFRASELLQTNGIVWVEGPSDRIYLKKWIEFVNSELVEGLHYSFQMYGGKLLSHYTVDEPSFSEYINLLLINKNSFIVMDSDMSNNFTEEELRDTKKRIIEEFNKLGLEYWITAGKEIENYLDDNLLNKCFSGNKKRKQFAPIKNYCPEFEKTTKVNFAKKIIQNMDKTDLDNNFDLLEKVSTLVERIKQWNNL